MLHIHNGDCSANTSKQTSLPGEHFAWREALIEGPTPAGLEDAEWRRTRAQHLSAAYGVEPQACERELWEQEQKLSTLSQHEEVVLWFEHDLFCQTILIYLLNRLGQQAWQTRKLSLICIGEFPGKENFRGLGELNAEQLASLFPERRSVTSAHLKLAASAWQAYCSPDPTDIAEFLQTDTSALPFLRLALLAHLKRFPSSRNGLGIVENTALGLIEGGSRSFADLFPKFGAVQPAYGLGDAQFWLELRRMNDADEPLLKISGPDGNASSNSLNPGIVHNAQLEITEAGRRVLEGEADFVKLNGLDHWLGGVHLSGKDNLWRWDEQSERIVLEV